MAKIVILRKMKNRHKSFLDYACAFFKAHGKRKHKATQVSQIKTCGRLLGDIPFRDVCEKNLKKLNQALVADGYSDSYIHGVFYSLQKAIDAAIDAGFLSKNPAKNLPLLKGKSPKVIHGLSRESLLRIERATYGLPSVRYAARLFLFQCRTGMSYSDMINLKHSDIDNRSDRYWLVGERVKTGNGYIVPLDSVAMSIIDEFRGLHENWRGLPFKRQRDDSVFPYIQIGTYNACLKRVGEIAGIAERREISSHKARHTFAERMLENGVSIDSIRRMLGHSPTSRATWLYAKVTLHKLNMEIVDFDTIRDSQR